MPLTIHTQINSLFATEKSTKERGAVLCIRIVYECKESINLWLNQ